MSSNEPDLEADDAPPEHQEGYADFAEFLTSDPELAIFRRYDTLATKNLLYLEAEMQLLELQLRGLDAEELKASKESTSDVEKSSIDATARCWEVLLQQSERGDSRASRRLEMIYKLRRTTKEYEKALLRRSQVTALTDPDHNSANAFKNWFYHRMPLRGSGYHLLDNESDFCTTYTGADADRLSNLIKKYFGYHIRSSKRSPESWNLPGQRNLYYYPASRIAWIVAILSILITSVLLIGAIVALYFVKEMSRRLGIVAVFTGAFAASLGLLTNARRAEIFGSTAAYAAVLVVFVGVSD